MSKVCQSRPKVGGFSLSGFFIAFSLEAYQPVWLVMIYVCSPGNPICGGIPVGPVCRRQSEQCRKGWVTRAGSQAWCARFRVLSAVPLPQSFSCSHDGNRHDQTAHSAWNGILMRSRRGNLLQANLKLNCSWNVRCGITPTVSWQPGHCRNHQEFCAHCLD
jgi:hypothetical protein